MRGDIVLFLGLVTVIGGGIIAAVIAVISVLGDGGGESSVCDNPLAPLGESEISQLSFQTVDVGLTMMAEATSVGNLDSATEFWYDDDSQVHDFTHDVDAPLRDADEELADELCEAVVNLEEELALDRRPSVVARQATRIRDILRDAAEALGFARPGG